MKELGGQFAGLFLLLGGLWVGYRRWIKPHDLTWQAQGFVLLIILTLIGGFVGSPFWWADLEVSFSWDLPPLASRMLAAAGWSFAVVTFLALEQPTYRRMRLANLMLAVYLAPLLIVIPLAHLNRFDADAPITYAFFIIVIGMTIPSLWYLWQQPTVVPEKESTPSSPLIRGWLGIIMIVMGVWGVALLITDSGRSDLIWVWPGDLLTSRLISVMLLAIAAGAALSWRDQDAARVMLKVLITYGIGAAIANLWNTLADKPIKYSYLIAFFVIFIVSALLLVLDKKDARSA